MSQSWSSKQRLSLEEQNCLQKDLFSLFMSLQSSDLKALDTMMRSNDTILDTIWKNIENDTHINLEKG